MPKAPKQKHKAVHPNSRKALQLSRQEHHMMKLERRYEEQNLKLQGKLKKLRWFKNNFDESRDYKAADIKELIIRYLHRHDDRLAEEAEVQSIRGRRHNEHMKHQYLTFNTDKEKQDFETCGIEVPNLLRKASLEFFRKWDGDARYLTSIDLLTVSRKKLDAMISSSKPEEKNQESEEVS